MVLLPRKPDRWRCWHGGGSVEGVDCSAICATGAAIHGVLDDRCCDGSGRATRDFRRRDRLYVRRPFAEGFFNSVRTLYNSRAHSPEPSKLSFVLSGVAQTSQL